MTDNQPMVLYTAAYDSVSDALADLEALEQLREVTGRARRGSR